MIPVTTLPGTALGSPSRYHVRPRLSRISGPDRSGLLGLVSSDDDESTRVGNIPSGGIVDGMSTDPRGRPGYAADKEAVQKRLRRIEGQVRGLQRMVDEDRYCINVLEQVAAVTKALQSVSLELLDDHLAHCVVKAAEAGGEQARLKVNEASAAIARLVRS